MSVRNKAKPSLITSKPAKHESMQRGEKPYKVRNVGKAIERLPVLNITFDFTLEENPTNVRNMGKALHILST